MYNVKESANRLKQLRKNKGVTQEQVAGDLNISVDTIRKNEQGVRGLSVDSIDLFANYYGTTVDYILNGKKSGDFMVLLDGMTEEKRILALNILEGILDRI
jgi:transcriptional regulator with XRE-family HTH domain